MWDENSATTHTSLKYCLHVCVFSAWKPPVFTLCVRLGLVVFIPEKAHTAWLAVYPPPAVCRVKSVGLVSETRLVVNQPAVFLSRLIQRVHALKKKWFCWKTSILPPRECGTNKPRQRRWWTARGWAAARCTSLKRKWCTCGACFSSLNRLF